MTEPAASTVATPVAAPADQPPRPSAPPLAGLWVFLACLALAAICNVGGLRGGDYIGAENALVRTNHLLNRLPGLQQIWFGVTGDPALYPLPQYAPLAQTMFFVERELWGDTLWAYRLVSVALHAGVGLMIWQLARRLGIRGGLVAALLFVAHPMTVDSVSWLVERRNPLAALLGLASAFLLLRAAGVIAAPTGGWKPLPDEPSRLYAIAAVLFVLGLFAHAAIAPLPLVVLLVAWWRGRKAPTALAGTCVALAVAGTVMLAASSSVERARSGVATPAAWTRAPSDVGELSARAQVAGRAVAFYAMKAALPYPIAIDYSRWQTPRDVEQFRTYTADAERAAARRADLGAGHPVAWLFPVGVVAALAALWLRRHRLGRGPFVAAAAFVLLLSPALGFVDLGWMRYAFVANRGAYLALVPALFALVWVGERLLARADDRTVTVVASGVAVVALAVGSVIVSLRFRNAPYFWIENAGLVTSRSWWPRYEFAAAVLDDPRAVSDRRAYEQAVAAIENVRRVRPDEPAAIVLHGLLRARGGDAVGAVRDFETSMRTFPAYAPAYFEAAESFREQAERRPTDPKPRLAALQLFADAAARDPLDVRSRVRLGQTAFEVARRLRDGDPAVAQYLDRAATAFDEAVQLRPYDVDLLVTLSRTLIDMGRLSDANNLLRSAGAIAPDRADVYALSARVLALGGFADDAENALRAATLLDPTSPEPHVVLGALRRTQQRDDEARTLFARALELDPRNADAARQLAELEADAATRPTTGPAL